ncbi:disease resistance protein RGA2-like [Carex rostrata]
MAGNLITSLISLATNLLPSITSSARAPSSSSNSNNSEKEHARAVEEDLERLMRTLKWIKVTLYDAEEREIIDHSVKFWLKELKKVAYDAEDVLSEYQYEVTRVQVEARMASEASGPNKREQMEYIEYNVQIPDGMVDRLNKIRSQFDEIAKDREALQLRESDGDRRPNNKLLRPLTGHMVDEEGIFGRAAEITEVINFILSKKNKSFSVISIVGKGGLGKTTLAQLVYKDLKKSQCFDLFGWVCVSEEFDVRRLIKATIESFPKTNSDFSDLSPIESFSKTNCGFSELSPIESFFKTNCGFSELSPLQAELAERVKGKTMLLVLDDVWNENKSLWELFRVPFKEAKMVRILMTTRNEKVADIMQTTTYFSPTYLPEDSSWQLFQHYAVSGTSDTMPIHLVDMGREITRKCGGLPLAVKSIASFLRHETDEELWIAHGYVESRSKRNIIEIGVEYYNELKERSFLDDTTTRFKGESCKLHDIIHDLARLNSENEHYSVDINHPLDIQQRTIPREAYHLYVRGSMGYVNKIPQQTMKGLRTIFMDIQECNRDFEYGYRTNCTKAIDQNLELTEDCQDSLGDVTLCDLTQLEVLRVLILKWDSLAKIPHSISKLKHLTYLSISSKRLKMLPLSISLLFNLLALEVECESLEYLPENISDLANLQFLRIDSCNNIKKLPKSLGSLTNLLELAIDGRFLDYVPHGVVNFPSIATVRALWNVRTIGWLKDMKSLKGMIHIGKLKNINNLEDAKRANLRNKCKLEILELFWDDCIYFFDYVDSQLELDLVPEACEGGIVGADDVHLSLLECLQPHPNLKKLRVEGYPSAIVPGWMRDPLLLKSIQVLRLESCGYIESLPFGNLNTLKYLYIDECSSIRTMQLELLPSQLEILEITGCECLELITGLEHLDMLKALIIYSCKTLKSLTMDGLQLVESSELFGDFSHERPQTNRQSISSLTMLKIEYCRSVHFLPDGLIPSGPCYVRVWCCGCPNIEIGDPQ